MVPKEFLERAIQAAHAVEHPWPDYAACEAALESAWGESKLSVQANNLFGQKQGFTTMGVETISIPTHEVLSADKVKTADPQSFLKAPELRSDGRYDCVVAAIWPKFANWEGSFSARVHLLQALHSYSRAIAATSGTDFIRRVSQVWSTDPLRADKVLAIYDRHVAGGVR